jgi:hypothetical protein
MMFEKAKPPHARFGVPSGGLTAEERARLRALAGAGGDERFVARSARRGGDAMRALEWSELTARLNAARDLRLLLRSEAQAPIEAVAASFGDAAASYFALLDDGEPELNHDALGQLKGPAANIASNDVNRPGHAKGLTSDAPRGDARDTK